MATPTSQSLQSVLCISSLLHYKPCMREAPLPSNVVVSVANLSSAPPLLAFASSILHLSCFYLCCAGLATVSQAAWLWCGVVNPEYNSRFWL